VHLDDRPGMLAALSGVLAGAGVNIEALAGFGSGSEGRVHLIVDDEPAAREALQEAGLRFQERSVISTLLPHRPGALAELTRGLAEAGVNIDAVYLVRTNSHGHEFALAVDRIDAARAVV